MESRILMENIEFGKNKLHFININIMNYLISHYTIMHI